jgi:hypothetical protein
VKKKDKRKKKGDKDKNEKPMFWGKHALPGEGEI